MPKKYNPRVVIPVSVLKFLALTKRIAEKHAADANASALNILPDVDWNALYPLIAQAATLHNEAEALKMAAEARIAERNLLLKRLNTATRRTAAFLKTLHDDNAQALGDWGFEVNAAPKKKKARPAAAATPGGPPLS